MRLTRKILVMVAVPLAGLTGVAMAAGSATLSVSPATTAVQSGSTFTVDIIENSGSSPVNAVQVNLTYPADKMVVETLDASGSAFDVQAENAGGNGEIRIARGKTGSPLIGSQEVERIVFKSSAAGQGQISLDAGSAVVSSDTSQDLLATTSGSTLATVGMAAPTPAPTPSATPTPAATPSASPQASPSPTAIPLATPSPSPAPTLPDTGAVALSGAGGLAVVSSGVQMWVRSRKSLRDALKR